MYQDFPSDVICLKLLKNFVGEPFRASLVSGTEKVYEQDGGIKIFRRKLFVSQCRNYRRGNPLVFHLFRVSKKFE